MSAVSNSRIWETPSENSTPISDSRPAQLPSIATLTNNLPGPPNGAPQSPNYPPSNRDSDPWPSQSQSTRKSNLPFKFAHIIATDHGSSFEL